MIEKINAYRELIKENIDSDFCVQEYDAERTDEIVEIMWDAVCSTKAYLRVDGEEKPSELVRSRLLTLDMCHIQYVFERLDKNTTKVCNIKA